MRDVGHHATPPGSLLDAREWSVADLVAAVREYLPADIRESHAAGNLGGCSCLAHEALDRLGTMEELIRDGE